MAGRSIRWAVGAAGMCTFTWSLEGRQPHPKGDRVKNHDVGQIPALQILWQRARHSGLRKQGKLRFSLVVMLGHWRGFHSSGLDAMSADDPKRTFRGYAPGLASASAAWP